LFLDRVSLFGMEKFQSVLARAQENAEKRIEFLVFMLL